MSVLSKVWTLKALKDVIRNLVNEIAPDKLQGLMLDDYFNLAVSDVAEMLNDASQPDYGVSQVISTVTPYYGVTTSGAYTRVGKIITKSAHGLTSADIGKLMFIFDGQGYDAGVTYITGITDSGHFTVSSDFGDNLAGISYYVFNAIADVSTFDLANLTYSFDKIIKLVSNTYGLIPEKKDLEFENITNLNQWVNSIVFNQFGNEISLKKGSGVTSMGAITLYYYRQPIPMTADGSYIDVRDKYVPLILAKVKSYVYEQLGSIPSSITADIESRTQEIRKLNLEENNSIKQRGTIKGQ